ncbi:hypothetical protein [Breznakiella homolactica]|uniref:Uncharacterized protein n=1 Tax=Breznakiella homolactica TaxID=2798577 RepID=A0A7T7XNJ7_9SPIR|nr:hypothetical protein [Breznakiella homolactica]QQO09611.1 hypothetical protein JFL75_01450 [Breznakiella homolactica]
MRQFFISLAIGLGAAILDTVPMIVMKLDKFFSISAFATWLILAFFIPRIGLVRVHWLNGMVTALLFIVPMLFLIYKLDPKGIPFIMLNTLILGALVGFLSHVFLK